MHRAAFIRLAAGWTIAVVVLLLAVLVARHIG
jgi:hypothetical protein